MKPTDAQGYPGTIGEAGEFDGGDTAAIIGTIQALKPNTIDVPFIPVTTAPLRHPDDSKWYGQPDRFSRDQLIPAICGGVLNVLVGICIHDIYSLHKKKLFLTAWNTRGNGATDMPTKFPDVCGPEVWALWIRYKRPWWARLVLGFLDLQTLIGAVQWRLEPKSNRVTRNHMLVCITARQVLPTLVSRLAYWINDWQDLINRWEAHCEAVREYQTADLFRKKVL